MYNLVGSLTVLTYHIIARIFDRLSDIVLPRHLICPTNIPVERTSCNDVSLTPNTILKWSDQVLSQSLLITRWSNSITLNIDCHRPCVLSISYVPIGRPSHRSILSSVFSFSYVPTGRPSHHFILSLMFSFSYVPIGRLSHHSILSSMFSFSYVPIERPSHHFILDNRLHLLRQESAIKRTIPLRPTWGGRVLRLIRHNPTI